MRGWLVTRNSMSILHWGIFQQIIVHSFNFSIQILYLSTIYRKEELQFRIGVFLTFASLSGAFGGLLAFEIEKMDGIGGMAAWS